MSRSGRLRPLPDDLPEPVRALLQELRNLKERSGRDLRALERNTHASRSSWGRWLTGETWIPADAVESLAELCGGDRRRLRALWDEADRARRLQPRPDSRTAAPQEPAARPGPAGPYGPHVQQPAGAVGTAGPAAPLPPGYPAYPGHPAYPGQPAMPVGRAGPGGQAEPAVPAAPVSVAGVQQAPAWNDADGNGPNGAAHGTQVLPVSTVHPAGVAGVTPAGPGAGTGGRRVPWWRRLARFLPPSTAVGVAAGLALGMVGGEYIYRDRPPEQARAQAPPIARSQAMIRARSWHPNAPRRVPYSQAKVYGGYRADGSGYASMVLGLPKPGPNSSGLASDAYTRRISMSELQPGDLVIDATGDEDGRFVLIFEKWANKQRTSYYVYQQRRGYGTDHRAVTNGLGDQNTDEFRAYRPINMR